MNIAILPDGYLLQFLQVLSGWGELHAPQRRGEKGISFAPVQDMTKVVTAYQRTSLPPKKYFLPPKDCLFRFSLERGYEPVEDGLHQRRVLFGVHACDLHALWNLDLVFLGRYPDPYYAWRRQNTAIIGLGCMPDSLCFCHSLGTDSITEGFDLFLTPLEGAFFVEVGTARGNDFLLAAKDLLSEVSPQDIRAFKQCFALREKAFQREVHTAGLPRIMGLEINSTIWAEVGEECLGCGACSMVCPTCYCFHVRESLELNSREGTRFRQWDSCLFKDYSTVAGGHNFRPTRGERLRQRLFHKFKDYLERYGRSGCVGCGRCLASCPSAIDILEIVARLRGEVIA